MNRGATVARRKGKASSTVENLDGESSPLYDRKSCQIEAADDTRGCVNYCRGDCRCESESMHETDDCRTMRPVLSDAEDNSGLALMGLDNARACNRRSDEPIATSGEAGSSHDTPRDAGAVGRDV
jgi:hypothetical protein